MAKLITELLKGNSCQILGTELTGPIANRSLKVTVVKATKESQEVTHYFMIYNCNADNAVKSDILERYKGLISASYTAIIGVRDVYPASDLEKLRQNLLYGMPSGLSVPIDIVLAVMEIEAWFLSEENHYSNLNSKLTHVEASNTVGFDICMNSTESIPNPASVLNSIYNTVGLAYRKKSRQIERTVNALDYQNLYVNVRYRNPSLEEFLDKFDRAI